MVDGPRGLKPEELDDLTSGVVSVVFSPRMRGGFPTLFCPENAENLRIIKTEGKIVSHMGFVVRDMIINGCRISVGNVGAVCTLEDYRKRGYAWSIMEDAIEKYRSEGVDMLLVSGYRNLYRMHGCTHVGRVAGYHLTADMEIPEAGVEVRKFDLEDLPVWSKIYRNEGVRFHRPYDDFQKLTMIMPEYRGKHLYSILQHNQIIAYAVCVKGRDDSVHLDEYAGSRQAVLGALHKLREEFGAPTIGVSVPRHDIEFAVLLDSVAGEPRYGNTGGTITILNFPQLCNKMRPLFEELVGQEIAQELVFEEQDGVYSVSLHDDRIVFDSSHDVARLIFGNPAGQDEQTEIPRQGKLSAILETIFPVSRPEYGLNYI